MLSFKGPHRCHRLACRRCRGRTAPVIGPLQVVIALIQLVGALLGLFRE
jgi:hypothetical protein